MNKFILLSFILLVFIIGSSQIYSDESSNDNSSQSEINWYSYDEGLELAIENNKHLYIEFMADWCGWCRKMEKDVYTEQEIIELLNNDFISIRINGDSKEKLIFKGESISQQSLARNEFGVRSFPTLWFLKPDGTKLTMLRGYQTVDFLQDALIYIKDYKYDSTYTEN
jgi:thioredoxin-related protein